MSAQQKRKLARAQELRKLRLASCKSLGGSFRPDRLGEAIESIEEISALRLAAIRLYAQAVEEILQEAEQALRRADGDGDVE